MSSLLDQAIVDANALKEAALKNAQQKVLDMYSNVVKEAVDSLLEEKKEDEKNPLMPDRSGLMTSPDLEIAVSKSIKPPQAPTQPFGQLADSYKTNDSEKVSISFTALEEALDLDEGWIEEDKIIPPNQAKKERTEEEEQEEEFDHTASNWGEMEEMSGADMMGSEAGGDYIGDSDFMEEGEDKTLEEMEMEEMYSVGAYPDRQNPDSDSNIMYELEEELMDEYGGEQEPDMMKEEDLEEELYGEGGNLKDPLYEEEDSLYGADREDLDEVLNLDMELSNQGHLGFNPVHYKEQQRIAKALEVHKDAAEKAKKKEKKLQEEVKELKKSLEQITESYMDLKKEHKKLVHESLKSNEVLSIYEKQNKKLTESLNMMVISNTKLLYTSKVLGDDSLNERQKRGLVENISKADSVEKVKVIYETIQSGVGATTERRSPKSLSEAVNRTKSHFINNKKENLDENLEYRQRMQLLAGIKNK
jgi:hypothetical protein